MEFDDFVVDVNEIRRQVDFYFSDYCLHYGRFFRQNLKENGGISLQVMNNCNMINQLTGGREDVLRDACKDYTGFKYVDFEPSSESFVRKESFVFNRRFFRDKSEVMLFVAPLSKFVTHSTIQKCLDGVEFVQIIGNNNSNSSADDSGVDLQMAGLNLQSDTENVPIKARPSYAKVYFKTPEACQAALDKFADGLDLDGQQVFLTKNRHFGPKKVATLLPRLVNRLLSTTIRRTIIYRHDTFTQTDQMEIKRLFKSDGVVLAFFDKTSKFWYLFFSSVGTHLKFTQKIKNITDEGDVYASSRFSLLTDKDQATVLQSREYKSYQRMIGNFYRK